MTKWEVISGRQWLQTNVSTAVHTRPEHQSTQRGLLLVTVTASGLKCVSYITRGLDDRHLKPLTHNSFVSHIPESC